MTADGGRFAAAVLLCAWIATPASGSVSVDFPIVFVQEPLAGEGPAGSRIMRRDPGGELRRLTDEFAEAADPCVAFDGERILFAGKLEASAPWNIWEMEADGSGKTRITEDLGDCREPIYLPTAAVDSPNFRDKVRWITFTSTAPGVLDDQGEAPLTSLYARNLEAVPGRGTVLWRTTYDLGGNISPALLSDGRVLFSSRQRGAWALMTISWAGENLNPFFGSHDGFVSQTAPCELPDRTVVFIESEGRSRSAGGRLARISLRRPLRTHRVLSGPDDWYRTPHPLPDGSLLVARRGEADSWGIYRFDPAAERLGPVIHDDPAWHDVDAVAVVPTPVPPGRIPTVEFASVLDVGALRTVGQLQCLNVYESDRPEAENVRPGQVERVRFVEGVPAPGTPDVSPATDTAAAPDSTWPPRGIRTRLLGEAPVEEDGSFYVNVDGDTPFYLETLDSDGNVVQTMRAWTWVRAGDQRGCIGCHEDKELGPENRATQALIRADPALLTAPPEDRPWLTRGSED